MSETYPVLINGEKKGTLTVSREGLTTRFDAKCEDPGTLVRLSVYGGGKEGYLGVMTPEAPERRPETGQTPEKRPETAPAQAAPVPLAPKQSAAPKPRERTGDVLWRDAGDGSLFTVYKNQPYRAIPMAAWGLPTERMVEKRTINGVEYAIFALKDGKIV